MDNKNPEVSSYQQLIKTEFENAQLLVSKRLSDSYTVAAEIVRNGKIIGYILNRGGNISESFHVNAVHKLAGRGQIQGVTLSGGDLLGIPKDIPSGAEALQIYTKASYDARKHPRKEEYWGVVQRDDNTHPTFSIVATYRGNDDELRGYKLFCHDSLDEYSLDLMETHQIITRATLTGEFGEHIQRGRKDWDWKLYFTADEEYESIDALPRELLGECEPPTGGHLERDNIFQRWESKQMWDKALKESAERIAEKLAYNQNLIELLEAGDPNVLLIENYLIEKASSEFYADSGNFSDDDLQLLKQMPNLKDLHLENCSLKDITILSDITNLTELSLPSNHIEDVSPLSSLVCLTSLDVCDNDITDLSPLGNLVNLANLDVRRNKITDLSPLSNLVNMERLWFDGNPITDVTPLHCLQKLTALDLRDVILEDAALLALRAALPNCKIHAYASVFNQLRDIETKELYLMDKHGIELYLMDKHSIGEKNLEDLTKLKSLEALFIQEQGITDIAPLAKLRNLTNLDLITNQITNITPLTGLVKLSVLRISRNPIQDITPLSGLVNLKELMIEETKVLSDITPLADLTNLTKLRLFDNKISDITALSNMVNLKTLVLFSNEVSDIAPLRNMTNLETLYLSNNKITDVSPLFGLQNLKYLSLGGNPINVEQIDALKKALPNCYVGF